MAKKQGTVKRSQEADDTDFDINFFRSQSVADLAPEITKHLKEQGLVGRWLNKKRYNDNGMHPSRWRPYKLPEAMAKDSFAFGANADGYLVRGDMILGVRSVKENAQHRKFINHKTTIQSGEQKKAAGELKAMLGDDAKVYEGYEENAGDED